MFLALFILLYVSLQICTAAWTSTDGSLGSVSGFLPPTACEDDQKDQIDLSANVPIPMPYFPLPTKRVARRFRFLRPSAKDAESIADRVIEASLKSTSTSGTGTAAQDATSGMRLPSMPSLFKKKGTVKAAKSAAHILQDRVVGKNKNNNEDKNKGSGKTQKTANTGNIVSSKGSNGNSNGNGNGNGNDNDNTISSVLGVRFPSLTEWLRSIDNSMGSLGGTAQVSRSRSLSY